MTWHVDFSVQGEPKPQGNHRTNRRGKTYDSCKGLHAWRNAIAVAALPHRPPSPLTGPLLMRLVFWMPRPKSAPKRRYPIVRPDLDKLIRAVGDALAGIMYRDDSQLVSITASKTIDPAGYVGAQIGLLVAE